MSEIVLLENAPTGPDHRQLAQLWFADNRLRDSSVCSENAFARAASEMAKTGMGVGE